MGLGSIERPAWHDQVLAEDLARSAVGPSHGDSWVNVDRRILSLSQAPHLPPGTLLASSCHMSTVTEIDTAIENLSVAEQRALALHLGELLTATESPDALAALDVGVRSLEQNGARSVSRQELDQKVRQRSGTSLASGSAN